MATDHLKKCVRLLLAHMHDTTITPTEADREEAFAAIFELIDQPWEFSGDPDVLTWRDGYETCMKDIVDAVADVWELTLPADPARRQEKANGDTE